MGISHAIILSQDWDVIKSCEGLGNEIGVNVEHQSKLANFLLELQEKEYRIAILDCKHLDSDNLNWVKVVHRISPRIPLIILSDDVDQKSGSKVFQEGAYYLCDRLVNKKIFGKILLAAVSTSNFENSKE